MKPKSIPYNHEVVSFITEEIHRRFVYDPHEGCVRRKNKFFPTLLDGKIIGVGTKGNTPHTAVIGITIHISHVVWLLCKNVLPTPGLVIDHIDGNRHNNAIDNLREVTSSENARNAASNKTSILPKGVYFVKASNLKRPYLSTIGNNSKQNRIGTYAELSEAVLARAVAEVVSGWHNDMRIKSPAFDWLFYHGDDEGICYEKHPIYNTMEEEQKHIFIRRLNECLT